MALYLKRCIITKVSISASLCVRLYQTTEMNRDSETVETLANDVPLKHQINIIESISLAGSSTVETSINLMTGELFLPSKKY